MSVAFQIKNAWFSRKFSQSAFHEYKREINPNSTDRFRRQGLQIVIKLVFFEKSSFYYKHKV